MTEGPARVEEIYQDRGRRAKQLKAEGKKIVGYLCCFAPVEIITAAGLVPFRIVGNVEESSASADAFIEPIACSFTRSCFAVAMKNGYDFLDGYVVPHTCDNIVKLYDIWKRNVNPPYSHFINIPHTLSPASFEFFQAELVTFKKSLERFIGREITGERLGQSIQLHNENRALVRDLNELRKQEPPLLSGADMIKVLVAIVSIPVEEANELLRNVIKEVKGRGHGPLKKPARLLVYGTVEDNAAFIELVEESGANVVIDDLSFGTRSYWHDVEFTDNLLTGIATRYLAKIPCPRTYKQRTGTHQQDLENRFGYLGDFVRDFNVNGVVIYVLRYCDTHAFDVPDVKEYFQGKNIPVLDIEDEYSTSSFARLKTRIQAFLEMIG